MKETVYRIHKDRLEAPAILCQTLKSRSLVQTEVVIKDQRMGRISEPKATSHFTLSRHSKMRLTHQLLREKDKNLVPNWALNRLAAKPVQLR